MRRENLRGRTLRSERTELSMTEQERVEKDWTEYLTNNPQDVIPMLAGLLSIMGMERIDEEETATPEGNQVSEQPATEEGKHGGGDA